MYPISQTKDHPPALVPGGKSPTQLCDIVLETLNRFSDRSRSHTETSIHTFISEIQDLRKFLDLIERVRRAKSLRLPFEEDHWAAIRVLLERCRRTLSRLCKFLAGLEAEERKAGLNGMGKGGWDMDVPEIQTLRGQCGFYVQTLQMSLKTVNLVYQWKSHNPQDSIYFHLQDLAKAIKGLMDSLVHTKSPINSRFNQETPDAREEAAILQDVERCVTSAETIMNITTTTVHEDLLSPLQSTFLVRSQSRTPPSREPSLNQMPIIPPVPLKSPSRSQDTPSALQAFPAPPRRPNRSLDCLMEAQIAKKKPVDFHLDDVKHQGSSDSDGGSIVDPEPDFEDHFSSHVYSELIASLQQEVRRELDIGEYQKAERSHRKAMRLLTDRERNLGIPFDDDSRTQMHEMLANIYYKQRELDKAKRVLNRVLMQEKKESDRKWRLYQLLALIYLEKDRLPEAEKYAKRAYIGREKSLEKGHRLVHESVTLLVQIYDQQGERETAEALRKIYRSGPVPPQDPQSPQSLDERPPPRYVDEIQSPKFLDDRKSPKYLDDRRPPPIIDRGLSPSIDREIPKYVDDRRSPSILDHRNSPSILDQRLSPLIIDERLSPPILEEKKPTTSPNRVRWGPDAWVDTSSINAPNKSGETPLISAISAGDVEMVRLVLQRDADVEARDVEDMTPLMQAVTHGYESIARTLLDHGAQVDAMTSGWTALHKAAHLRNIGMVKLLLERNADVDFKGPKAWAPKRGSLARMNSAGLDDSDADADSDRAGGWTVLLRAASSGDEAMVRLLLDGRADIDARNPSNMTPLHCAAEGKHEAIVDLLLIRGAQVNAEDEFGWKPLHRVLVDKGGEKVAQLLLSHDAHVDVTDYYRKTPLHHAIEKGNDSMVYFLLNAGADIEARDMAERTPLHIAIECRLEVMVRIMLESGADATAKDKSGRDALAAATRTLRKSPEIIGLLDKHKKELKCQQGSIRSGSVSKGSIGKGSISRGSISKGGGSFASISTDATSSKSSWWSSRSSKKGR